MTNIKVFAILLFGVILLSCNRDEGRFIIKTTEKGKVLLSQNDTIGIFVSGGNDQLSTVDYLTEIQSGVFEWTRTWELASGKEEQEVRLLMEFITGFKQEFTMIPGVSYNGNEWLGGEEPKEFQYNGIPRSFAYHRTTIPGATYSEGDRWSVAMFGKDENLESGFACSLIPVEDYSTLRLIWPEEEQPQVFIGRKGNSWRNKPGYKKTLILSPDQQYSTTAYLVVNQSEESRLNYARLLDVAWELNYRETHPWYSHQLIKELGFNFLLNYAWDNDEARFKTALHYDNENKKYIPISESMLGWAGANGSISVSLLEEAFLTGNDTLKTISLRCLDSWSKQQLPCGLIDVAKYVTWFETQDISNQAQGAEAFFEAYLLLKQYEIDKPEYLQTALNICNFMLKEQFSNGKYGKSWNNNGDLIQPDGTIGSFMVRPMAMAYEMTGDTAYLESSVRALNYYYDNLIKDGFATAGAIDIYTIDKEGAVGLLEGGIKLLEITQDQSYVTKAEQTAYYLSTWQYHHDIYFKPGTPMAEINYKTFGGTTVATVHQCLDSYGVKYINELLRLSELTGKVMWKQRAKAIWDNSSEGISDGTLIYPGLAAYPGGAQSETFFQTNWGIFLDIYFSPELAQYDDPMGYISNWLVIWPIAYRLDVLRKTNNLSIFE